MFIHWGLYSIEGWQEQAQLRQKIPRQEYETLIHRFHPTEFNPEEWVLLAKEAGMRYITFTTKHCDGFCLWDTKQTDYNVMHSPYGKDVLKLLAEACAKHDIALCLYYSLPDWHHPNAYNERSSHQVPPIPGDCPDMEKYVAYVRAQMVELLTGYGKIWGLFWDIPPKFEDRSINELARKLQPGIMINDRGYDEGDFSTPERFVPEGKRFAKPTEACQSIGYQSWGYRTNEDYYTSRFLTESIDKIMAMGGNYLLNLGPMPNGKMPEKAVALLRRVGGWYQRVKESIEGAEPFSQLLDRNDFLLTRKGNTLYLHFYHVPDSTGLELHPIKILPKRITVLNDGSTPASSLDEMPTLHEMPGSPHYFLHIYNLPAEEFPSEPMVLKLEFDSLAEVEAQCAAYARQEEARL